MERLLNFIEEMNSSNSTNHKVEILTKYKEDEFIKKVLHYTYSPYKQYHITSANLKKRSDLSQDLYHDLFGLLDDLNERLITGHAAIAAANGFIEKLPEAHRDLFYSIIDRNIETRATATLINRVIPGLIPTFDVALAFDASKVKNVDLLCGDWMVSRKLDGIRCLCIIRENGDVKFFSRNGKEFETLDVLKQEIVRLDLKNCVLDGEICVSNSTGEDDFQGILKQIQRKDHTIPNPKYWVFDILTLDEFESGTGRHTLTERLGRAESLKISHSKIVSILPQIRIVNEETLVALKTASKDANWEGLIARRDVFYEGTRTKNMLKLKEFYDSEYIAVDVIMGPQRIIENGQERSEDMLSAVIINHMGNAVNVGSGFTLQERRDYYLNPEKIIGKAITVQYFEETVDQNGNHSLRFPVFKWNHGESRSI
jgi:DNA ligase-1